MSELRWILLGLGLLLIAGLYVWERKAPFLQRFKKPKLVVGGVKPAAESTTSVEPPVDAPVERPAVKRRKPEKIVTLRVVRQEGEEMKAEEAVLALKRVGLTHGRYGIFHRMPEDGDDEPVFSVASLTEPGSFDLANLQDSSIAGLSLFLALPGRGDPVVAFDTMVGFARDLAEDLDGIVLDERGSSWSIQRERYIREEIIEFHHQLSRA